VIIKESESESESGSPGVVANIPLILWTAKTKSGRLSGVNRQTVKYGDCKIWSTPKEEEEERRDNQSN